jgi:putative membrane protein
VSDEGSHPGEGVETHRLHPLTVLLEVGRVLGRFAWFLVMLIVVSSLGGRQADPATWIFFLAGSGILVALARYLSLRYWIDGGRLVIRSGIISRQLRTIPLDKIQNVELRQNAIQQLAGVVDFRIETAAGPEAEAHLAVLARDEAERLKGELLSDRGLLADEPEAAPPSHVIWQASLGDLLLLGATSNRAGAIVGALAGLLFFLGQELPLYFERLQKGLAGVAGVVSPLLAGAVLLGAMLLLGWLLSIVLTVVRYFGFQVTREPDGRLRRRYGLLSRFETVVNPVRIQLLRLGASWLRRRLGFWEVAAHTAGSSFDGQRSGSALLCPLLRRGEIAGFCDQLLPGLDLDTVDWRPVSPATIRRGFIRYLFVAVVLVGSATAGFDHWAWTAALVPGALLAWGLARRRYRVLAWARHAGHLVSRTGVLHRRLTIVPESKIQWVGLTQSPFQRRLGIASASVATAAGAAHIVDLEEATAAELQRSLSSAASAAGAWLPDAV